MVKFQLPNFKWNSTGIYENLWFYATSGSKQIKMQNDENLFESAQTENHLAFKESFLNST